MRYVNATAADGVYDVLRLYWHPIHTRLCSGHFKNPGVAVDPQLIEGDIFQMIISVPEFDQLGQGEVRNGQTFSPTFAPSMSGKILDAIRNDPAVTIPQLAVLLDVTERTIERSIAELRKAGVLRRIGGKKGGKWDVVQ